MQQAKETYEGVGGANVEYEAETVIASVTGINTGVGHQTVQLDSTAIITASAGATETTLRLRREGIAGQIVAAATVSLVKGAKQEVSVQGTDVVSTEFVGGTWVLTGQSAAAEKQKSVSSRVSAVC